ncbi:hypothetical protein [Ectopseudomonas composti]|uniref:hypothetical protein n=1 Tax=Ectopseudomonas composti TaxID=658457 RepID=UPI000773FD16|nr:hypothetical protein [Pseudomonas composti]
MSMRQLYWSLFISLSLLLVGCGARDDPQAALEAAVQQLQDNIETKRTGAVMDQLHGDFLARQELDSEWAKRTMTLLFLRHKNVKVIALGKNSWIDPAISSKGYTEAQVGLSGAEGLIPDSARHYSVKLQWWLDGGEWKLARLDWE